ncbi:hypothetical protein [Scatolibacter rhodanostii]|uniref:hypothetical protein n=1 Tax=Scatolibacter rhodanostii TaxID=2014781 RepID=UPI000C089155|nr:hypothetical protein [Scatolibacter rhodanostii]
MSRNKCPHCHRKISFFRKLVLMDGHHGHPCPHCQQKMILKNSGYKSDTLIMFLMALSAIIISQTEVVFLFPIVVLLLELANLCFLKIIPYMADEGISHNKCPHCQGKISYLRKTLLMHIYYGHKCPHCQQKIKLRAPDDKTGLLVFLIVVSLVEFLGYDVFLRYLPIPLLLLVLILGNFTKIIPYTYDSDEEL